MAQLDTTDPDSPPLQPGEKVLQVFGPLGYDAILVEENGRVYRCPVRLFALLEHKGKQYVRGYTNVLQTAPIENDTRFLGYFHADNRRGEWDKLVALARKVARIT